MSYVKSFAKKGASLSINIDLGLETYLRKSVGGRRLSSSMTTTIRFATTQPTCSNLLPPAFSRMGSSKLNLDTFSVLFTQTALNLLHSYNLTQDLGAQVTSPNFNPSTLEQLTIVNPSSGGVYNLPVCSASDLSGIPWCLRLAPNDNSCQVTQCPCGSDRANITVNNKPTQYFKDFALPAVLTAFAAAPNTAAQIKDSVCPLNTHSGYGRKRDLDGIVGRRLTHPEDVENAAMWDIVS